uniref:ubiquitinyl hydrolase 1 n=1 Tax=Echinostoma caproni TaxID=27848 RepID=A0A183AL94_9TREM
LIEALRLCEEEQQDAPEFHCLFMNLLEARFRESGLSIVNDLFRGEIVYETRCLNCGFTSRQPSKFLELSLKVSSNSLVGCIADYLKEEPLVGENRYACSHCGEKQDGIRRVYITRAPSLLCVQLLRFTYDPRTGQRKKQKASVRLPDTLELTALTSSKSTTQSDNSVACLVPNIGTSCPRMYKLCGVLLHIGAQPTSGHYIAVVRDSGPSDTSSGIDSAAVTATCNTHCTNLNSDTWTVCNDMELKRSIKEISKSVDAYLRLPNGVSFVGTPAPAMSVCTKENEEPSYYWIGRRSLLRWRILARDYVKVRYADGDQAVASRIITTKFNADVLCPHGKLRADSKSLRRLPAALWNRLVALFPGAVIPTFPVPPEINVLGATYETNNENLTSNKCTECELIESNMVQRALKERQLLTSVFTPSARRLNAPLSSSLWDNDPEGEETRIRTFLTDCFSPRKAHSQGFTTTHTASPLSEHGQLASTQINKGPLVKLKREEPCSPDPQAIYLVPMEFINRWRRFIRNPSPQTVLKCLPSGLNDPRVLCPHSHLIMPWWTLISDAVLCPITAEEWSTFSQFYPPRDTSVITGCEAGEGMSDEEEDEEGEDYKESEALDTSTLDEDSSDTTPSDHSAEVYPPLYLIPDQSGKSNWCLQPSQFAQVCSTCHAKILAERNSYQNARFRVRLVLNAEEALLDSVQGSTMEWDQSIDGPSSLPTEPTTLSDPTNQVGADGDIWPPRVLRVDAKLVFGPHVRLSRIVLGCLLVGIHSLLQRVCALTLRPLSLA